MKQCSRCGAPCTEEAKFCPKCGFSFAAAMYPSQMPNTQPIPMIPQQAQKKSNKTIIIVAVLVAVILVLAIGLTVLLSLLDFGGSSKENSLLEESYLFGEDGYLFSPDGEGGYIIIGPDGDVDIGEEEHITIIIPDKEGSQIELTEPSKEAALQGSVSQESSKKESSKETASNSLFNSKKPTQKGRKHYLVVPAEFWSYFFTDMPQILKPYCESMEVNADGSYNLIIDESQIHAYKATVHGIVYDQMAITFGAPVPVVTANFVSDTLITVEVDPNIEGGIPTSYYVELAAIRKMAEGYPANHLKTIKFEIYNHETGEFERSFEIQNPYK